MISGASEQELLLANARADIVMALDNTSTYESWLIIDTYIEKLEEENEKLKLQKDTNNCFLAILNDKIQKENERLKNNWNELKEYLTDYKDILESQKESVEGLDLFEEHTLDNLDEVLSKMQELEEKEVNK